MTGNHICPLAEKEIFEYECRCGRQGAVMSLVSGDGHPHPKDDTPDRPLTVKWWGFYADVKSNG